MTREQWKATHRQLRIIRREMTEAMMDCVLFGTGAYKVGQDIPDFIQHVPLSELRQ